MKHFFAILLCAVLFCACNDDEERNYVIKYVMRANTDSAVQMLWPIPEPSCWVENYYECSDTIKESDATYSVYIECRCEDTVTVMTGELYVDGKLKATKEAKSWLRVSYQFK